MMKTIKLSNSFVISREIDTDGTVIVTFMVAGQNWPAFRFNSSEFREFCNALSADVPR